MKKTTQLKPTQTNPKASFKLKTNVKAGTSVPTTSNGRDPDAPTPTLLGYGN